MDAKKETMPTRVALSNTVTAFFLPKRFSVLFGENHRGTKQLEHKDRQKSIKI